MLEVGAPPSASFEDHQTQMTVPPEGTDNFKGAARPALGSSLLDVRSSAPDDLVTSTISWAAQEDLEEQPQLHIGDCESLPSQPPWDKIWKKLIVTIVLFLIFSILVEKYAQGPVTRWSKSLMEHIGLPGLFIGVLILDGVPQPFTYVPLIFMAVHGGVPKVVVFMVCAMASYVAALLGYTIGHCLRRPQWGTQVFARLSAKYPWLPHLMRTKGFVGVLTCAVLPVPLALATWTAGFFAVKRRYFMFAACGRLPKILVFVLLSGVAM